ncbi:MAG: CotH kinase family protein, partial [Alloprevotella sp.]|nr:CotH kinase family protein [Alloprevotella sp.]
MKRPLLTPIRTAFILITILCALVPQRASCQLRLSEIQQSNNSTLLDDLNEFPDSWVEIHNPTTRHISTKDYAIGLTPDPEAAWPLPAKRVMPYGFTTVLCDKQASGWHTDFRLDASGGSVYLFRNGVMVDSLKDYPKQPVPGISYGYPQGESENAMWLLRPTPGIPNSEAAAERILPSPMFSRRGFVATGEGQPVQISLIPPAYSPEGAEIRYTLNGKDPTERDSLYRSPITLRGTTTIRAKYFAEGHFPSATATQSYIFHPRERTLPVISIVTDSAYLYDEKIGIDVTGSYSEEQPNFYYNWRRPANIELFEPGQAGSAINQLCEIRMSGNDGGRKHHPLRPMIVYAHKRFGTKHLKHELFPEDKPGKKDYKSIMLRNSGNDFGLLYFRDAIIQRSVGRNVDLDWQAYRPAIVYVNGVYHGLLNMRERSQEDNIFTNHHGIEDIDLVEYWWKVEQGNAEDLEAFSKFYHHEPHADLYEYDRLMDVREFADYFIMELFYNNTDFPANNTRMWRPTAPDGRWRWIAYDTDVGLGRDNRDPNFPSFDWMYGNVENPHPDFWYWGNNELGTALWRRLISIPEFRDDFIMRFTVHMGDFLRADRFDALADTMHRGIASEYPHHAQRWGISANDHDEQLEFV